DGADILDTGGESTRPFADPVPIEVELQRVIPLIQAVRQNSDIPISIDTTKAEIAREAL
ncbi:MAG TPA: dihydropteroate synthase, partial [Syntrophobacteraceae bacterium]|nr:dihydropteroate synthase [Syntrophobacteraceae bacterium]